MSRDQVSIDFRLGKIIVKCICDNEVRLDYNTDNKHAKSFEAMATLNIHCMQDDCIRTCPDIDLSSLIRKAAQDSQKERYRLNS